MPFRMMCVGAVGAVACLGSKLPIVLYAQIGISSLSQIAQSILVSAPFL